MLKQKTKRTNTSAKPSKLPIPRREPAETFKVVGKPKPAAEPVPRSLTAPAAVPEASAATIAETTPVPTPATASKLSCLDAAAEVLRSAAEPMRCRELVAAMGERALWTSTAPTPHQTLASALLREITKKGPASRFRKADRGQFSLASV